MTPVRVLRTVLVFLAFGGAGLPLAADATIIDFDSQPAGRTMHNPEVPLSVNGVKFSAIPAEGFGNPVVIVERQSEIASCGDPSSLSHVLGTVYGPQAPAGASLPIKAEFPPGVVVTKVSIEVVACQPAQVSLSLYDASGALLATSTQFFSGSAGACSNRIRGFSPTPVAYVIVDCPSNGCAVCPPTGRCSQFWIDNFTFERDTGR